MAAPGHRQRPRCARRRGREPRARFRHALGGFGSGTQRSAAVHRAACRTGRRGGRTGPPGDPHRASRWRERFRAELSRGHRFLRRGLSVALHTGRAGSRHASARALARARGAEGRRIHAEQCAGAHRCVVRARHRRTAQRHLSRPRPGMGLGSRPRQCRHRRPGHVARRRRAECRARGEPRRRLLATDLSAQARPELRVHRFPGARIRARKEGGCRRRGERHRRRCGQVMGRRSRRIPDLLRMALSHRCRRRLRNARARARAAGDGPACGRARSRRDRTGVRHRCGVRSAGRHRRDGRRAARAGHDPPRTRIGQRLRAEDRAGAECARRRARER